jgi:Caspase domain/PEGA domain
MKKIVRLTFALFNLIFVSKAQEVNTSNERGLKVEITKKNLTYKAKYALIIGINNYKDDKIPPLQFAVNDAKAISQALINDLGFEAKNVIVLLDSNATRQNILDTLQKSFINDDNVPENSQLLVYFAGHGTASKSGNKGFLLNYDAKEGSELSSAISMDEVGRIATECKPKHVLFLIDACYGGFSRSRSGSSALIKNVWNQKSREVITAGNSEEKVLESASWQHSAFTKVLLDAIQKGNADVDDDKIITSRELFGYLEQRVASYAEEKGGKQTPQYGKFIQEDGSFFLELKEGALSKLEDGKQLLNEEEIAEKLFSKVVINSNVLAARVFIDNREVGYLSNGKFEYSLKAGFYKFELKLDKYENTAFESFIKPDTTLMFSIKMESKYSKVSFKILPADAAVIFNNNFIGTGSFSTDLPKGRHEIIIEKKGYKPERTIINLVQDETFLSVEIEKILATIELKTSPSGALVTDNTDTLGRTPLTINLNYGKHNLILSKKDFLVKMFPIDVLESGLQRYDILLAEAPEQIVKREIAKLKAKNISRFLIYGGISTASLVGAKYSFTQFNKIKSDTTLKNPDLGLLSSK